MKFFVFAIYANQTLNKCYGEYNYLADARAMLKLMRANRSPRDTFTVELIQAPDAAAAEAIASSARPSLTVC